MFFMLIKCFILIYFIANGITIFMNWWERQPIVEEKSCPIYIYRTYEDIINEYD